MKKLLLIVFTLFLACSSFSQGVAPIVAEMRAANQTVVDKACTDKQGLIITNRALNVFLANKIASYLSEGGNTSLYKNYATLNTSDGKLSINSNVHVRYGSDERIKSLTTVGVKANLVDGFGAIFSDKKFNNDLGFSFRKTWFFRGSAFFDACGQTQERVAPMPPSQKRRMNARRATIINHLEVEMTAKAAEFETAVGNVTGTEIPGDDLGSVQAVLRNEFYSKLRNTYVKKFAEEQASALEETECYNLIKTHWISLGGYLPVTTKKFSVAPSFQQDFLNKEVYPWEANLSYNSIWESRTKGRFFLFLSAGATMNTSVNTGDVDKVTLSQYKNLGGTDPIKLAQLNADVAYVGNYSNFVTPLLKGQFVWFPKKSNVGVSFLLEQNIGRHNPLNGKFGIPIRLNDKDGEPTVNFEIQFRSSDISNQQEPEKSFGKKSSVGISVGLPFSSIIY